MLVGANCLIDWTQSILRTELNLEWRSFVETVGDELLGTANKNISPSDVILRKVDARVAHHTRIAIGRRLGRQCKHNELQVEVASSMANREVLGWTQWQND